MAPDVAAHPPVANDRELVADRGPSLADRAFLAVFSRLFVYSILFEDAEVDERYLDLDERSRVLAITGAGCSVAGMLSARPQSIDAVDVNHHHLALTALKCTAAARMEHYGDFYDFMGRGWAADPGLRVRSLSPHLPSWVARYWRRHSSRFRHSLYQEGLTAKMFRTFRRRAGVGVPWARGMCAMTVEERVAVLHAKIAEVDRPIARAVLDSPLQQIVLGINFRQRDRVVSTGQVSMTDYFIDYLTRVMSTELETNWVYWYAAAGTFNHAHPDAVPPYLRRDRWEKSLGSPTEIRYRCEDLFAALRAAGSGTWSHYLLCDAIDWMDPAVQRRLFDEIRRTAEPGAIVLMRSVSFEDPVAAVGADTYLDRLPCSDDASRDDRSCAYRQVNFYRVRG